MNNSNQFVDFTMECPFCRKIISQESESCPKCGKSLKMVCRGCGQVVKEFGYTNYKLCPICSKPPNCGETKEEEEPYDDENDYHDHHDYDDVEEEGSEPREVILGDKGDQCGFKIYE